MPGIYLQGLFVFKFMAHARIDDYFIEHFYLLTRNEIIVYCYLVKSKNKESGQCNPKQKKIADDTGLKASRLSEAICGLEEKGWAIADETGNYFLPEKVTESVRKVTKFVSKKVTNNVTKVTNNVTKSYEIRKKSYEIRNKDKDSLNIQEQTIEQTKNIQAEKDAGASGISAVFEYWKSTLSKKAHTLTPDRKRIIATRLKTFTVEQLKLAIDGTFKDDWLMGRDERSTKAYNDFETIFRNDSKVEGLIEQSTREIKQNGQISNGNYRTTQTTKQIADSERLNAIIADSARFKSPTID